MLRAGLGMLGFTQIRHIPPIGRRSARDLTKRVYAEIERDFGVLGPPITLHAHSPETLAAAWLMVRETLVAKGQAPQASREAVATAVSKSNECPYCIAIHGHALNWWVTSTSEPADPAITAWASAVGKRAIPFPEAQLPELGGVALMLQYTNRMVNVFLRDLPMPPGVPAFMLTPVMKVLGPVMRSAARTVGAPGATLDVLPDAPLPAEFAWMTPHPAIAGAFARAAATIEAAGQRVVPVSVRDLVRTEVDQWDGGPKGISRSWCAAATEGLSAQERPLGTLALLVALASYQVDDRVVSDVQQLGVGNRELTELCAWASFTATQRIAGWIR